MSRSSGRPPRPPIGLKLARGARLVSRAFDEALGEAGGSLPIWLVLLNVKVRPTATQRELAAAVGVREATLTHHLNSMEADELEQMLDRLVANVGTGEAGAAPWAGLIDRDR